MTYLPDLNVWVALTVGGHIHHASATTWLSNCREDTIAFCRVTQMGFLRLLTNSQIMAGDALSPAAAWRALDAYLADTRFGMAPEPSKLEAYWRTVSKRPSGGPNFWTDAYLAAFVAETGHTLVTFDKGFRQYKNLKFQILD